MEDVECMVGVEGWPSERSGGRGEKGNVGVGSGK